MSNQHKVVQNYKVETKLELLAYMLSLYEGTITSMKHGGENIICIGSLL